MAYLTPDSGDSQDVNVELGNQTELLESIDAEQKDQGDTLDGISNEQVDQGATLDSINTEGVDQGLTLDSIDSSLDNISTEATSQGVDISDTLLWMKRDRCIQEQILLQLKILTKHWEMANDEIITERDLI